MIVTFANLISPTADATMCLPLQAVFEGMKAQHSAKDRIVLFRPDQNAARMEAGAHRLSMPPVPKDQFVNAVQDVVRANADYVSAIPYCTLLWLHHNALNRS
jgi:branched-subunit amino acid aminotransferase/4-amino-4-deoxychorismate lyase